MPPPLVGLTSPAASPTTITRRPYDFWTGFSGIPQRRVSYAGPQILPSSLSVARNLSKRPFRGPLPAIPARPWVGDVGTSQAKEPGATFSPSYTTVSVGWGRSTTA